MRTGIGRGGGGCGWDGKGGLADTGSMKHTPQGTINTTHPVATGDRVSRGSSARVINASLSGKQKDSMPLGSPVVSCNLQPAAHEVAVARRFEHCRV